MKTRGVAGPYHDPTLIVARTGEERMCYDHEFVCLKVCFLGRSGYLVHLQVIDK
jgi:hypothetical protein